MKVKQHIEYRMSLGNEVPRRNEVMAMVAYAVHMWEDNAPCTLYDQIMWGNFKYDESTSDLAGDVAAFKVYDENEDVCGRICIYCDVEDDDHNDTTDSIFLMIQHCTVDYDVDITKREYFKDHNWVFGPDDLLALEIIDESDWEEL